jgi:prepilin-type N-terminal cleavage/methylation domain-containing protein
MLHRLRKATKNESGFTLIELLIVIVILGVLAGITVFAVSKFQNDGVKAACKADGKNVEVALEAYYAKEGTWAGSPTDLVTAGYLKEAPNSTKYTITIVAGATSADESTVTATYAGASCFAP